jgi:gamma-glutamyl hercynylcysteine S-oxide synthase
MQHNAFDGEVTHDDLVAWYRRIRARTRSLYELITEDAYYDRPIPLRNPLVFYEGHLPAFAVNTLVKLTHKRPGIDARFETLFARGIDPADEASAKTPTDLWPTRAEVLAYNAAAERLVEENLENSEATFTILEHELMHQETLMYLLHALPHEKKRGGQAGLSVRTGRIACPPHVRIPAGPTTMGQAETHFGWDNEFPSFITEVPEFTIDTLPVTNAEYLAYLEATGANPPHFWHKQDDRWQWRGMFAFEPLNENAPVYVTYDEATAYARWKGKRLPTEAEWQRAAEGTPLTGTFDFATYGDPVSTGQGAPSAFGVYDLIGNGWEWTSTLFAPFPGFKAMPSYELYSADFFDEAHYVLKGASPVTPRELVRPSFRNWFRPGYPWVFAKFRCAR